MIATANRCLHSIHPVPDPWWVKVKRRSYRSAQWVYELFAQCKSRTQRSVCNFAVRLVSQCNVEGDSLCVRMIALFWEKYYRIDQMRAESVMLEVHKQHSALQPGPLHGLTEPAKKLCVLDAALRHGFRGIADQLWDYPPPLSDQTAGSLDLFSIVCRSGTLDDMERFFDLIQKEKGADELNHFLVLRSKDLGAFFSQKEAFVLEKIFHLFSKFQVDPAVMAERLLRYCRLAEQAGVVLRHLSRDQKRELFTMHPNLTYELYAKFFLFPELTQFFDEQKESGAGLSAFFRYRSPSGMTMIDLACYTYRRLDLVEFLNLIEEEDFRFIQKTAMESGYKTPLQHCWADFKENTCGHIIKAYLAKLRIQEKIVKYTPPGACKQQ